MHNRRMDYIEKLLVSQRKKKRIIARRKQGYSAAIVAEGIGCSRQYVDFIYNEHLKSLKQADGANQKDERILAKSNAYSSRNKR